MAPAGRQAGQAGQAEKIRFPVVQAERAEATQEQQQEAAGAEADIMGRAGMGATERATDQLQRQLAEVVVEPEVETGRAGPVGRDMQE